MPEILPIRKIRAKQFDKEELGGVNLPLRVLGEDEGSYVVKLIASERLSNEAFFRELAASRLATALGMKTPEPVEVDITPEFAELYLGKTFYQKLSNSIGSNFGTKVVQGTDVQVSLLPGLKHLRQNMEKVFGFDAIADNSDRNALKPNCILKDDDFWVIDHEITFAFVLLLFPPNPLNPIVDSLRQHIFYPCLEQQTANFDDICERAAGLPETFWDEVLEHTPTTWKTEEVVRQTDLIKNWFARIVASPQTLSDHLKNSLL